MKSKDIQDSFLYLCTDLSLNPKHFFQFIEEISEYIDIIQIRSNIEAKYILRYIEIIRPILNKNRILLSVNNRADIAVIAQADILHIGQDDISVNDARALIGKKMLIGMSTHTKDQFIEAQQNNNINYVSIGPIYKTPTKPEYLPCKLSTLKTVSLLSIKKPFFAIGGIEISNINDVLKAGAKRVAVVRALTESNAPKLTAKILKERILHSSS